MNECTFSQIWFDRCFENTEEITLDSILKTKIVYRRDYNNGGFYMIINQSNNTYYVGKSKDYIARLKQHLYDSSKKTNIDIALKNKDFNFKYFLLARYTDIGINFFNRKLETIIEHRFISLLKNKGLLIYNKSHYGHI